MLHIIGVASFSFNLPCPAAMFLDSPPPLTAWFSSELSVYVFGLPAKVEYKDRQKLMCVVPKSVGLNYVYIIANENNVKLIEKIYIL